MHSSNGYGSKHYFEETTIPVPWGEVAARWWGPKDKQPILAIHGWQDNAGTWNKLIPLLPPTLSILCIDLPGMGLSSHYLKGMVYYKFWDGLVLIRRIVKHYKWDRINLMAHSLGGSISFMYAAVYPDEVDRMICIDIASPAVHAISDTVSDMGSSIDQTLRYEESNKRMLLPYNEVIDMAFHAYSGSVSKENCKVMMERGMSRVKSQGKNGYYFNRDPKLKFSSLASVSTEESLKFAAQIKCKFLNINVHSVHNVVGAFNERYGKLLNVVKEKADLTLVEVEGTHHIHLEAPDKIAHHIIKFLEDLC